MTGSSAFGTLGPECYWGLNANLGCQLISKPTLATSWDLCLKNTLMSSYLV